MVATFALRSALSAIGNAGAVPAPAGPVTPAASPYLAGSATGLGAGEAPRRGLTQADLAGSVRAEAAERETAAGRYEHAGQPDRAGTLRREAAILRAALGETVTGAMTRTGGGRVSGPGAARRHGSRQPQSGSGS